MPAVSRNVEHAYHLYVVRTPLRDTLHHYLAGAEVTTSVHYPRGAHLQKAYAYLGYEPGSCPNAEKAAGEVLSLPVLPQLSDQEVERVIRLFRFFLAMR